MKRILVSVGLMVATMGAFAQNYAITPVGSLNIVKEVKPAILDIVPNSIRFADATGNNAIDANETCSISFSINNRGKGEGLGCEVRVKAEGATAGVHCSSQKLSTVPFGETKIRIPITTDMNTQDGKITFSFEVYEPNGFGTDVQHITLETRKFNAPLVKVADYKVTSEQGTTLQRRSAFKFQIAVQNVQYGLAENVSVRISYPQNVMMLDGNETEQISTLNAGEVQYLTYEFIANNNYASEVIPIQCTLNEKHGKYAENRTINLNIGQKLNSSAEIKIASTPTVQKEITLAMLSSDVDKDIPMAIPNSNPTTFAVIIANEQYSGYAGSNVAFARNDGFYFAEYCKRTLGLPDKNVRFVQNATLNQMRSEVAWLKQVVAAYKGDAKIIFYYAGHGIPDETTHESYLLPSDGNASYMGSAYKLNDLYNELGGLQAKQVTVFLDACFSGAKRSGEMLVAARGVAITAKAGVLTGNMVVFSAAQGNETAYPNSKEQHGMFTYFLLKKLQESKGNASYGELADYITENVSRRSIVDNGKPQTPTVSAAPNVQTEWKSMKLK